MKAADAVVIAELVETPPRPAAPKAVCPGIGRGVNQIEVPAGGGAQRTGVLRKPSKSKRFILATPLGSQFLITGVDPKALAWATPIPLTKRSRAYIDALVKLPENGPDRLVFFQDYLEDQRRC